MAARRTKAFVGWALSALVLAAESARADDNTDCEGSSAKGEASVAACTRLIDSGTRMGLDLAAAYFYRGLAQYDLGQHDRAIEDFTVAIEIKPDVPEPYYGRGNSRLARKEFPHAITDYTAALRLKPDWASALNNRAWAYLGAGDPAKGLSDADRAVALAPGEPFHLNTRANILKALGRKEEAIRDLRAAMALNPSEALKKRIGVALKELGVDS